MNDAEVNQNSAGRLSALIPRDENARLDELRSFAILDTAAEQAYDDITQIASSICDTPIALISLVDDERQWFKSRVGLEATETSRDLAFCAHAILDSDNLMVVPDASSDIRFAGNPLVTGDPNIRFYAGAPLVTNSGHALGTLCVIDREPRELTAEQRATLDALARQVMAQLNLRRSLHQVQEQQWELRRALKQRDTLVAAVSHELRTPLTAIHGFIEVLRETDAGFDETERQEFLATASRQAEDLGHIIDDLLVATRLEQDTLEVARIAVDLKAQIAQVIEGIETPADRTIEVAAEQVHVWGDPARVRQITRNFVTNALRYGGDRIAVATHIDAGNAHLEVRDDGEPIAHSDLEKIFIPYRVSSGRRPSNASIGLGLSISRQLAHLMGGDISYRHDGANSIFDLSLPIHS